jgi:hypothetical protein
MIVIGSLPNLSHLIFYISKSYDRESSSVYGITFKLCDFGWILNKKIYQGVYRNVANKFPPVTNGTLRVGSD